MSIETAKTLAKVLLGGKSEWLNEDELPKGYPYDAMFPHSKVGQDGRGGVRMFPFMPAKLEWHGTVEASRCWIASQFGISWHHAKRICLGLERAR